MPNSFAERLRKILWAGFLVSLPVTNFRYFPAFLSSSKVDVRPLLIYPLLPLVLIYILPALWKRKLPKTWIPFLVFLVLVLISSSLPIIQGFVPEMAETGLNSRLIRAGITLLLSAAIFLTVSLMSQTEEDLQFTLKWLYAGMALALLWGLLQVIFVIDLIPDWYLVMERIQGYITMNVGSPHRVMGLTLEPSWFADQITALWLPWVLPAVLMNKTVYKRRWGWLTVEKVFLALLLLVLVFTLSRAGFVVVLAVMGFGILFLRPKWDPSQSYLAGFKWFQNLQRILQRIPPSLRKVLTGLAIVLVFAVTFYFTSMQSNYISRMWQYWLEISRTQLAGQRSLSGYFRFIGFGPRFVYWETAYRIFTEHPLFGVGLGNYTFHFQDMLPAIQVGYEPELISRLVPGGARIVTAKNFFARLLAETGILGTAAFVSFLLSLLGAGMYLWLSKSEQAKFWGAGTLLALIAFLVDSFSYDSLAIPNPWVVFGLITSALMVYYQKSIPVREND